jgi:hypothetical protein
VLDLRRGLLELALLPHLVGGLDQFRLLAHPARGLRGQHGGRGRRRRGLHGRRGLLGRRRRGLRGRRGGTGHQRTRATISNKRVQISLSACRAYILSCPSRLHSHGEGRCDFFSQKHPVFLRGFVSLAAGARARRAGAGARAHRVLLLRVQPGCRGHSVWLGLHAPGGDSGQRIGHFDAKVTS